MYSHLIRTAAVALGAAAILAQSAGAGGEPKNEWPFTRPVTDRSTQSTQIVSTAADVRGEPKNELPFTRPAGRPATVVVQSSADFSWTDGAIGLVAGLGVALSGGAGIALARNRSPRTA